MRAFAPSLALFSLLALSTATAAQDLERPEGWKVRFDQAGATEADLETFVGMAPGWHVTSGPAAIYWHPDMTASGTFRAEMEVFLFDPQGRREAFGLFVGGRDLESTSQRYVYFLLRDGGQFIIKERRGSEAPTLRDWTRHEAIRAYADRGDDTSVGNVLAVEAGAETVRFLVNGAEVATMPRAGLELDGIYGFRVNHALDLHVSRLEVSPLRSASQPRARSASR